MDDHTIFRVWIKYNELEGDEVTFRQNVFVRAKGFDSAVKLAQDYAYKYIQQFENPEGWFYEVVSIRPDDAPILINFK